MKIYFSDFFEISPDIIEDYGAFNISLLNDLPLFIDPFLLFNSEKKEYQKLHNDIVNYVIFLKKLSEGDIAKGLVKSLFRFPEVKQNWFGYSKTGNSGTGLGNKFAFDLCTNLTSVFSNFGQEEITIGSHLEKLCLIESGVGRDNISDFVTNLIKGFLLDYTQKFSQEHIPSQLLKKFHVPKVLFNYKTCTWGSAYFILPQFDNDYVLLTPKDILTKDDTWINRQDILKHLDDIIQSVPNEELRAHMNQYFFSKLPNIPNEEHTKEEEQFALSELIREYPKFLDYYIRFKESKGDKAVSISKERVEIVEIAFVKQLMKLAELLQLAGFYTVQGSSYDEAMKRVLYLKQVVENNDGYRLFYVDGKPVEREKDLHIIYKLTWHATDYDVNAEVNNGRGPVDFKISKGSSDKTLVEFKLAKNTKLKQNLAKQVDIYEDANQSDNSIKVIFFFSFDEEQRVKGILKELGLQNDKNIILIDASKDNKESASNVKYSMV